MSLVVPTLAQLRRRQSVKWSKFGPDVLPLFVAEMDYEVAEPVREAMIERIAASDLGYAMAPGPIGEAFAGFAERRWGWQVDPARVRTTTDVSVAIVEVLRRAIAPGDGVVVTPPVYPPFFDVVPEAGGRVVEVPLLEAPAGAELDLAGIEEALRAGARAVLIANPHNPLGSLFTGLAELADLAERYGATVVADEIHAPLTHSRARFTPFLTVSEAARRVGVTVTSASKAWNVAGTKCALMVAASPESTALLDGMWEEVTYRTSLLGLHASVAAFEQGEAWLDEAVAEIEASFDRLERLLAQRLPQVVLRRPPATYLAWLDFRGAPGWGPDPAARAMRAGVALEPGHHFGREGEGFARLNVACPAEVLEQAVERLATAG